MLDLISNGRVDFGIGEGATRLELGGFKIPAKEKRALALEAAEQIANMMVLEPYPGFEGAGFSMPCRNVIPKPVQKPHPPMWMACTNRDTIRVAARHGPRRPRLRVRRPRRGAHLERDLLRHHQERRVRAARPHRERQPRDGVGVLDPPRPRRGDPPRPGRLRVLLLRGQRAGGAGCAPGPLAALGSFQTPRGNRTPS